MATCDGLSEWLANAPAGVDLEVVMHNEHLRQTLLIALRQNPQRAVFLLADDRTRVFVENTVLALLTIAQSHHLWAYVRLPLLSPSVCSHLVADSAGRDSDARAAGNHPVVKVAMLSYVALAAGKSMCDVMKSVCVLKASVGTPTRGALSVEARPLSVLTHVQLTVSNAAPAASCVFGGVRWELSLRSGGAHVRHAILRGTTCWVATLDLPCTALIGARVSAQCVCNGRSMLGLQPRVFLWHPLEEVVLCEMSVLESQGASVSVTACIDRVL